MKDMITALLMMHFALSAFAGSLAAQQAPTLIVGTRTGEIRSENSIGIKMIWLSADSFTMEVRWMRKADLRTRTKSTWN